MKHDITTEDVKKLYLVETMKHERDKRKHGPLDTKSALIRATRTALHARLQEIFPTPQAEPGEDPDLTYLKQKSHGKALWSETDRLVAEAKLGAES